MRTTAGRIMLMAVLVVGTLMGTAFGAYATDDDCDNDSNDTIEVLGLCLPVGPETFDELGE